MRCFRAAFLVLSCLLLNSCIMAVTRGIGTVERQLAVGDEFGTWRTRMAPIPAGKGRLIVYPGGHRSFVYEATSIGKGGEQDFTVDTDVCTVLGNSFVYYDLAAGHHEITSEGVSKLFGYQKGKNRLNLDIAPSSLTYVRIDKKRSSPLSSHYLPGQIQEAVAEKELKDMPIYNDGLTCRLNKAEERKPR